MNCAIPASDWLDTPDPGKQVYLENIPNSPPGMESDKGSGFSAVSKGTMYNSRKNILLIYLNDLPSVVGPWPSNNLTPD